MTENKIYRNKIFTSDFICSLSSNCWKHGT